MTFADVLAKTTITGFSAAEKTLIEDAMRTAYNGSATAKKMFDDWIAAGNAIPIQSVSGQLGVTTSAGTIGGVSVGSNVLIADLGQLQNASYIDNHGKAVEDTLVTAFVHEFVHQLTGRSDNFSLAGSYRGDTVKFSNIIYKELGLSEQNSYIAYDSTGDILTRNFEYTNGTAIDRSFSGDSNFSSAAARSSSDLLIGGQSANTLQSGDGDDFLFGAGGNDELNGGNGSDTVVYTGDPVDYDVRLNADGTWTSRHVRGTADEGTDTLKNLERIQFEGGETFNLTKNGLGYQNDFAFVIDQTGSMFDDIAAVKSAATGVINGLFADNTIDARVGIVGFRDNTIGEPTSVILSFTDQDSFADRKTAAINGINSISVSGGGDFPETAFDGLLTALDGSMGDWRLGAGTKKVALFTDATAKDAFLLPTVLSFATNIGATISVSASSALGSFGSVDTFEFSFDGVESRDLISEGDELPPFVPSDDPVFALGGTATVQITTIFIETFISPDPALEEVSESTGGTVLTAANADEVVERLLEVVTASNYLFSVDAAAVVEGDSGLTDVTFTLSRDRSENAATVSFATTGTAAGIDVIGAPSSVSFAIGETSKAITVSVIGDTDDEGDETFGLQILEIDELANFSEAPIEFIIENDDAFNEVTGTDGRDNLVGTDADDIIRTLAGSYDKSSGGAGADQFIFGDEATNGVRERDVILDFEVGIDSILLEGSAAIGSIRETSSSVAIFLEGDRDAIYVRGEGITADNLTIITDDAFV